MKSVNLFTERPEFYLCNTEDCKFNKEGVCLLVVPWDSDNCRAIRNITECTVIPRKFKKVFNDKDLINIALLSCSKGQQRKWITYDNKYFLKERFYYELRFWNDDLVEVIASKICSDLHINALKQESALINKGKRPCVCSEVFTEKFLPFTRIDPEFSIRDYNKVEDRIKAVVDTVYNKTKLDITSYLFHMTVVDCIVANEDRHLFNFGVFMNKDSSFSIAKLFDFGLGLFEHNTKYNNCTYERALQLIMKQPFLNWDRSLNYFSSLGYNMEGEIDLSDCIIPNDLAKKYLIDICARLSITIKGI